MRILLNKRTGGFTLVELLVVVAIIALLISLFTPNLTTALRHARTVQCANNLHKIGQAVTQHRATDRHRLEVAAWPMMVLPFLDGRGEVLICPETDEEHLSPGYVTLKDKGQMEFTSGQISALEPEEGIFMAKLSQTQWDSARADGKLSGANSANYWTPPPYVPDGTPNIYWLCYEDILSASGGGDRDLKDVMLKVTHTPGQAEVRFFRGGTTCYGCSLVDYEYGAVRSLPPIGNTPLVEVGEPYYFHVGGCTTYGMNMDAVYLAGGTGKILAVDYNEIIVHTDVAAWDPDPSFARHRGKMNVLHMDGSVKLRRPQDIDPGEASVAEKYWQP